MEEKITCVPLVDWISKEGRGCRSCAIAVLLTWYLSELEEKGHIAERDELYALKDEPDVTPEVLSSKMDAIKEKVDDPELRKRLVELDTSIEHNESQIEALENCLTEDLENATQGPPTLILYGHDGTEDTEKTAYSIVEVLNQDQKLKAISVNIVADSDCAALAVTEGIDDDFEIPRTTFYRDGERRFYLRGKLTTEQIQKAVEVLKQSPKDYAQADMACSKEARGEFQEVVDCIARNLQSSNGPKPAQ